MTHFWRIAAPIACTAVLCGSAILWSAHKNKVIERKLVEEATLCRARAEQGDADAQTKLGRMYYHGLGVPQNYIEAVRWYRKAADQGDAQAEYAIGYSYFKGEGVPQDYAEALNWYRKAAGQGYAKAENTIGGMYYYGAGVPLDYKEAVRWYQRAADQGDALGQDALGAAYYNGKGVPQDYSEAARWYREAADQGYGKAEYELGYLFHYGLGVPQNRGEAIRWNRRAADHGDERAKSVLRLRLGTVSKVSLSVALLGSLLLLMFAWRDGGVFDPRQRATTLPALLGLTYVGVDLYWLWHFDAFQFQWVATAFYLAKELLSGACVAMLVFMIWPRGVKTVLTIAGILFAISNICIIALYHFAHLTLGMRFFYPPNGFLVGASIPSAILWLRHHPPSLVRE